MIGKIIVDKGGNEWTILDKIRVKDKDVYLVIGVKNDNITILDPLFITSIKRTEYQPS
jgi:hypothetical protein